MNLLNDCSEVEDESAQTGARKRGMSRRLASLRHCTVLAMSNLLNANVDSGLMHSIGKTVDLAVARLKKGKDQRDVTPSAQSLLLLG